MALGKKIIEWNYTDMVKGMSTSDQLADAGFSPTTDGGNLLSTPGIMFNPPSPTDASTNVTGAMIASCEDPTGNYARLYTSSNTSAGGDGRFFSLSTANVITQRGSTDSTHTYVSGKTDMIAFDGEAYITSATDIVRWSSIGSSNTFNTTFFAFNDALSPHPALTFNNFAYYGDGNELLRQASAGATPSIILTLPTSWVIVALGIDPGSGSMLISVIGQINLSDTINSGARIGFYDGFSSQVSRYVQVDDMVTAFAPTEGSLYCSYGQNLGLWNGSGITFKRHVNVGFDYTELLYKQHFTSIGSTLLFIERARIVALGPVRQNGDNIFYPVLTNTIAGVDTDLTHIASIGSNQVSMAYDTNQFFTFSMYSTTAANQEIYSNNYNFDDELWVRRARVIYDAKVSNGVSPGSLVVYNEDGLVTETDDDGLYSLTNDKGVSSAVKDINNINLRLKQMSFGLLLNQKIGPTVEGSVSTGQSHAAVSTLPFSLTVNAGLTDSMAVVLVTSATSSNVSGTINGVAMTAVNFNHDNYWSTMLYYKNPPAGSSAIILSLGGNTDTGYTAFVLQNAGTPTGAQEFGFTGSGPAQLNMTTLVANSLILMFAASAASTQTPGTSQTALSNFTISTSSVQCSASKMIAAAVGAYTPTVTFGSNVAYQINGIVVPPVQQPVNPGIQRVIFYGDPANITGSST